MTKALLALCCCAFCLGASALEVNTANEAELDSMRGLGPASTARVLKAREDGPFKDWADLMQRVKGIKPTSAARLSASGLTVNQQPYTAPYTSPASAPTSEPVSGPKVP
jgi:competence protein ComEA